MSASARGGASRVLPLKHHPFKTTFPSETTLGLDKTSQFYLIHLILSSFPKLLSECLRCILVLNNAI